MSTKTRRPTFMLPLVFLLALGAGAVAVYEDQSDTRKVTFYGAVGDGKEWAGGFTFTVTVNARSTPYVVKALPHDSNAINTYLITKKVKVGTAVGALVTAEWPGKPVKAQLRGFGVDARPAITVSPKQPYASAIVK